MNEEQIKKLNNHDLDILLQEAEDFYNILPSNVDIASSIEILIGQLCDEIDRRKELEGVNMDGWSLK